MTSKPSHGGSRVGAGRKARTTQKSKGIWCGQISDEDRSHIIKHLTPEERFQVLMAAANTACSGLAGTARLESEVSQPANR